MIRVVIDFSENECPWDPRVRCRLSLFADAIPCHCQLERHPVSFDNGTCEAAMRLLDARLQSVRIIVVAGL
jgi:hypothetical protein